MLWVHVRLWYLTVSFLAWAFYTDPTISQAAVVLCRPCWAPVWLLQWICRLNHTFLVAMVVFGLLLASDLVVSLWLRCGFCVCAFLVDLGAFAAYTCHPSFIFIYTCVAMVLPPGEHQSGVLRVIAAHQLGSAAINKLRVGGLEYLKPNTLEYHLRFARDRDGTGKPHALIEPTWIRQRWISEICLQNPWLIRILNWLGPLLQLSFALLCLLGSGNALYIAFAVGCTFHLGSLFLFGIFFPFNILSYMLALLPDSAQHVTCLLNCPALIAAILLFGSTILMVEDWPLTGIVLYPYNAQQIKALESLFGHYFLAHTEGKGNRESSICLTELVVSPFVLGHFRAVHDAIADVPGHLEPLDVPNLCTKLSEWLRHSRRFVDLRKEGQPGRCFDTVKP
eukprot:Skav207637  [mRNA]  locus=scaffold1172:53309:54688:+ [translate_table: standard]